MSSPAEPDVSVVVPVYRNADTLPELERRLIETLEGAEERFELVFVVDASPDDSAELLRRRAADDSRLRVLELEANVGQHAAVLAGLRAARGAWCVSLDADLQDPPEAIPRLLATGRRERVPVVFAGRRGAYESGGRLLTSRLFKRVLARLTGLPPDAGLFVALARDVVDRLPRVDARRPFVTAMVASTGAAMRSVPVERTRRASGRSAYRGRDRLASAAHGIAWAVSWRLAGGRRG